MIAQDRDGLSIGAINEGVMNGKYYMSFIPFQLTAIERKKQAERLVIELVRTLQTFVLNSIRLVL